LTKQHLRDVAAQKPAATKNRYQLALHICSVSPREVLRALCTTAWQLSRPTCVWRARRVDLIHRARGTAVDNITRPLKETRLPDMRKKPACLVPGWRNW
jgi:hypothetical protein